MILFGRRSAIRLHLFISLLGLSIASCANNPAAERWFAPDPELQESPNVVISPVQPSPEETTAQLPNNFPEAIPRYPDAELVESELRSAEEGTVTRWQTGDPPAAIAAFYEKEFKEKNWEIVPASVPAAEAAEEEETEQAEEETRTLAVRQQDLEVTLSIPPKPASEDDSTFEIRYNWDRDLAEAETETPSPASPTTTEMSDSAQIPESAQESVEALAALGVFSENSPFEPDKTVTRAEFARWLVAANNALYANTPGKQIRLVPNPSQPAFKDVPKTNPNFAYIQALAEAGLIPSPLSGDASAALFQPDAPLTRENLVAWKVPLDTRQGLPKATLEDVQKVWGFQDTAKVNPLALRALLSDYQNGEQANVRRAFGFTTLFQPKKPVTRAEAAMTLGYFGYQGEGVTAQEAVLVNE
ncbi:MAG: S-layer homology domain-containing protein [Cyanobacteriota bacterium]|nr:S-layer homology domain-containing protein [Cyanobacteriota bacterium]